MMEQFSLKSLLLFVTARVWCKGEIDRKKFNMQSDYSLGACIWCLHSVHTNLSSHTGRQNKQVFHSAAGNAKYIYIFWTKIATIVLSHPPHTHDRYNSPTVQYHYSFLSHPWTLFIPFMSWTLFIPFTSVDTIHSIHFFSLRDCSLNPIAFLRTWVSTPPVVSLRLILQAAPA